jgi:septal ring factor EnvC (AmiA/AmiB activator)
MPSQGVIVADDALGREIKQLRADLKEDLAEFRPLLAGLVSREVHDVQLGRVTDRISTVERDLDRLVAAMEAERRAEAERRKTEADQKRADEERRAADRRITKGALLGAIIGIVVQVLSSTGILP